MMQTSLPSLPEKGVLNDVLAELVPPLPARRKSRVLIVACGVKVHFPWDKACARYEAAFQTLSQAANDLPVEIAFAPEPFEDPSALCALLDRELRDGLSCLVLFHAAYTAGEIGSHLGLYSMTFNNDLEADYLNLQAFREFRAEAAEAGFGYFLEVFAPNVEDCGIPAEDIPTFVNDALVRCLAGVSRSHWPKFLKIPYFGPKAMEELANYDSDLIVGILGGGSGTTYDAFKQLTEAKKYGARVALYGRKIKDAEHPLTFVKYLRALSEDQLTAEEAVQACHADLEKLDLPAKRDLKADMELTDPGLSYAS
jgi:hypothetical protein